MIDLVPGYDKIPRFDGFRQVMPPAGLSTAAPATLAIAPPQSPANAFIESAVVFGGVPLCGYIFVTKKGPAAWLAALLGVGIGYLYLQSGNAPAQPPLYNPLPGMNMTPAPGAGGVQIT